MEEGETRPNVYTVPRTLDDYYDDMPRTLDDYFIKSFRNFMEESSHLPCE